MSFLNDLFYYYTLCNCLLGLFSSLTLLTTVDLLDNDILGIWTPDSPKLYPSLDNNFKSLDFYFVNLCRSFYCSLTNFYNLTFSIANIDSLMELASIWYYLDIMLILNYLISLSNWSLVYLSMRLDFSLCVWIYKVFILMRHCSFYSLSLAI